MLEPWSRDEIWQCHIDWFRGHRWEGHSIRKWVALEKVNQTWCKMIGQWASQFPTTRIHRAETRLSPRRVLLLWRRSFGIARPPPPLSPPSFHGSLASLLLPTPGEVTCSLLL